ncbi:hypothetical protein [Oscillospiraceae bacterium]|nr:hypothetical protein [Oscillospiraceae bacterium]
MDPGGKSAPLARRTPKECVFAQPCHVFLHTFIRNSHRRQLQSWRRWCVRHALFSEACPPARAWCGTFRRTSWEKNAEKRA